MSKKKSGLPYEHATSGDAALGELQRILLGFGCSQFGTMQDVENGETILQFKHRGREVSLHVSWRGYAAAYLKKYPYNRYRKLKEQDYKNQALKQGKIAVCSILRDWVKAQVTAIETGMMSFDAVFMPHMLLANGDRLVDYIQRQKLLPNEVTP